MERFEVIVIGSGPAGSVASRELARTGARVALVDGSHPREKACGGGVTGRALELLPGSESVPSRMVRTVRFEAGDGSATVTLPDSNYLRVFDREGFDAALRQAAIDAGAIPIDARVTALDRNAGWNLRTDGGRRLQAPWLVGADGAGGLVRKKVWRPFGRGQLSIAAGSYVDGIDLSEIVIGFVDDPQGYLWSFPRPGHLAVGTCAQADVTTPSRMHEVTDRWLDAYPQAAGLPRRRYAWPIPSLSAADLDAECPAGDGWLLAGDAAGLVDPITREGIFFAVRSGQLAARALAGAKPAESYAASVRDEIHMELRRAARLKAGFFRPRFTSLLIDALNQSPAIRGVMIDLIAGRQTYNGLKRRLLSTLEVGLAWRLLRGGRRMEEGGRSREGL